MKKCGKYEWRSVAYKVHTQKALAEIYTKHSFASFWNRIQKTRKTMGKEPPLHRSLIPKFSLEIAEGLVEVLKVWGERAPIVGRALPTPWSWIQSGVRMGVHPRRGGHASNRKLLNYLLNTTWVNNEYFTELKKLSSYHQVDRKFIRWTYLM